MSDKVLITYSTHGDSTAQIADGIADIISKNGTVVDVKPVSVIKSLDDYRVVILGSNIRAGLLASPMKKFLKKFRAELETRPVAVFVVCMSLKDDTPKSRTLASKYLGGFIKRVNPVSMGAFAGVMEYEKLGFFSRLITKWIVRTPEGDYRDWESIGSWADELTGIIETGTDHDQETP